MTKKNIIQGRSLVKSTGLNLLGYVIPMLFLVFATPIITSGLGIDRYGVLSIVWLIIGYFVIFDLGIGAATTRFIAVAIGENRDDEIPQLLWTTTLLQLIMGLLAGAMLAALTPFLVERVFNIPQDLIEEGKKALWIASLSFPVTFISGSLNGLFSAFQRFDIVNVFKIINSVSIYIAGILCIYFGSKTPFIVMFVVLAKVVVLALQVFIARHLVPFFFRFQLSRKLFRSVADFAGWIAVSNILNSLAFYIDRFIIGATLSMSALTYYSVPFDLAARLWVISTSLTMTLFPAFAILIAKDDSQKVSDYFTKSIKFLVMVSGPVVCLLLVFSRRILEIWLGEEFAAQSTLVLQLLLAATLIDYPGIIASTLLEGAGQPRQIAMVKMLYLPIHALLIYIASDIYGIVGAALALVTLRVIYSIIFTLAAMRLLNMPKSRFFRNLLPSYFIIAAFMAAGIMMNSQAFSISWSYLFGLTLLLVSVYGLVAWYVILDPAERVFIGENSKALMVWLALTKSKLVR